MSRVSDRITNLENLIEERESKLRKKITSTKVIYGILVLVVAGYTLAIVPLIKKESSVDKMLEIATGMLSQHATNLRTTAVDHIKENSDGWAKLAVTSAMDSIPKLGTPILAVFDDLTDYIVQHLESVLIPAFTQSIVENAGELKDQYAEFKDEEKMEGLSLIFVEVLEDEMDKYLNDRFVTEVFKLQRQLHSISGSNKTLTKREDAQRRILVNWMYLSKHGESGESFFSNLVDKVKHQFKSLLEVEEEDDIEDAITSESSEL
jgi:hypothetical protein